MFELSAMFGLELVTEQTLHRLGEVSGNLGGIEQQVGVGSANPADTILNSQSAAAEIGRSVSAGAVHRDTQN